MQEITQAQYQQYKQEFESYWLAINRLIVDFTTVRRAAELCELYALPAYDVGCRRALAINRRRARRICLL